MNTTVSIITVKFLGLDPYIITKNPFLVKYQHQPENKTIRYKNQKRISNVSLKTELILYWKPIPQFGLCCIVFD